MPHKLYVYELVHWWTVALVNDDWWDTMFCDYAYCIWLDVYSSCGYCWVDYVLTTNEFPHGSTWSSFSRVVPHPVSISVFTSTQMIWSLELNACLCSKQAKSEYVLKFNIQVQDFLLVHFIHFNLNCIFLNCIINYIYLYLGLLAVGGF